jgi:TIR domain
MKQTIVSNQVIVHRPLGAPGRFQCQEWGPLPFPHPAMISIVPTNPSGLAQQQAQTLALALERAVRTMAPSMQISSCSGPGPAGCRGHAQSASTCVLVLVGDGGGLVDYSGAVAVWSSRVVDPRYKVVPICPPSCRSAMVNVLPSNLQGANVTEWMRSAADKVSAVLGAAGLVSNDYRAFISYCQKDGQKHADDLFGALTSNGFDVFLDHVGIAAGASILDRIREELAHKAVIVVLETPLVGSSSWVSQEVAISVASRLGILAVHFPNGHHISSLSNRRRMQLSAGDLGAGGRFTKSALDKLCDRIVDLQNRWLTRRRYQMQKALSYLLLHRGILNQRLNPNGCLDVVSAWSQGPVCSIRTTPRLAELDDFREVDGSIALPDKWHRAVIARGTAISGGRQSEMQWLSGHLKTGLFDEGEIANVSRKLADPSASELRI